MFKIPELLAPAGGMAQLKAAVENGADAVYLGGKLFNARINADNFRAEEMRQALDYAHLRGVKLYVTMNTLIRDCELRAALEYAVSLYKAGVDALIIQDLGFAQLVRSHLPDWSLHLSTQGTVYNAEGVRKAKMLGFSRVVLARELSLEEIREITAENLLETEVFIHGALCICYSGQCQMSREIGGRSGNRGECAQPCRLPYSVCQEERDRVKEVAGPAFVLSPKDLCMIEQLRQLSQAGVASLKIEGRMKTAEYVAIVTGIYRKYLDLYAENGEYQVDPADLQDLNQIFNRGGFTEGYLTENSKKNLMSGDLSKHQGIYLGEVVKTTNTIRRGDRQRGLVVIRLAQVLSMGDGIEIRNKELSGNRVTFMKHMDKKIDSAKAGNTVIVGYIDGAMEAGDKVYKISDKNLMQRARASYEGKSGTDEKTLRKMGVYFNFNAGFGNPISLKAVDEEGYTVTKELSDRAEKAIHRELTEETVLNQLKKTGGTPFRVLECAIEMEEGISVPLSKINELRRITLEELEENRKRKSRQGITINWSLPEKIHEDLADNLSGEKKSSSHKEEIFLYYFQVKKGQNLDSAVPRIYVPYDAILNGFYQDQDNIVPVIPNITKGWHDQNIRKNFDKIVATSERKGIAVGNLGWIEPFVAAGVDVFGDYGLNLFNSMDFLLAKEMGIKEAMISHEASLEDILAMDFHGVAPEVVIKGRIPVMTSEHCPVGDLDFCVWGGKQGRFLLKDRKEQLYPIIANGEGCQSMILSHKETNLLRKKEELKRAGIYHFRIYEAEL